MRDQAKRLELPFVVKRCPIRGGGCALEFIHPLARVFPRGHDQALRQVSSAVIEVDQPTHDLRILGIDREPALPAAQYGDALVAGTDIQPASPARGSLARKFKAFANLLWQEFRHWTSPRIGTLNHLFLLGKLWLQVIKVKCG